MRIRVKGARENNLRDIDAEFGDGLTVVTGGSGKTSLIFEIIYHESRRRFQEVYEFGRVSQRFSPADVDEITGLGPAVAVGQNLLNRNPNSTLATASGLHPFLRLLYARFGVRKCRECGELLSVQTRDARAGGKPGRGPTWVLRWRGRLASRSQRGSSRTTHGSTWPIC